MSPILVRPVREQLEHDRIIRQLQTKYKRKYEVGINPGSERTVPVGLAPALVYPDLVLQSPERSHRVLGLVEVETTESVNTLEAMAEWVPYGRQKAPFYLYVPVGMVDVARRLCEDYQVPVAEVWSFSGIGDQVRFAMAYRSPNAPEITIPAALVRPAAARRASRAAVKPAAAKPAAAKRPASAAARPARSQKPAPSTSRRPGGTRAAKSAPARPGPKVTKSAPARKTVKRK